MQAGKDKDCGSCDAPIKFARVLKDDGELGGRMPISLDSREKRFVFVRDESGEVRVRQVTTFLPHFADCTDPDDHRKSD